MTEWLTTGAMIDRLKVGEVAESDVDNRFVKRNVDGIVYYRSRNELEKLNGVDFIIYEFIRQRKWRILPTYVSFEEAMKALREGKSILLHREGHIPARFNLEKLERNGLLFTLHEIFEAKWSIEEGDSE